MEEIAKKKTANIVVCEGWDERCLDATAKIIKEGLAKITLLGNPDEINTKAKELNLDISQAEIIDFKNSELKPELIAKLVEVRSHKGMDEEKAKKLIENENYFGCLYALSGYADGVAGSAICSTAELMRPSLQLLRKKGRIVSEVSIITIPKTNKTIIGTDFSLNINPDAEGLGQMTKNAVHVAKELGIEPRVALLSFSTKGSGGDNQETLLVREAVEIVKKEQPDLIIDGELQFDAAINPNAAKRKCPDSPIKGEANILIFPNLTASNIFAHSLVHISNWKFNFTILEGLQKPVGIIGRSVNAEITKNVIVSCAMQVNAK